MKSLLNWLNKYIITSFQYINTIFEDNKKTPWQSLGGKKKQQKTKENHKQARLNIK